MRKAAHGMFTDTFSDLIPPPCIISDPPSIELDTTIAQTAPTLGLPVIDEHRKYLLLQWFVIVAASALGMASTLRCVVSDNPYTTNALSEEVANASVNMEWKPSHEQIKEEANAGIGEGKRPAQASVYGPVAKVLRIERWPYGKRGPLLGGDGSWLLEVMFRHPVTERIAGHLEEPTGF